MKTKPHHCIYVHKIFAKTYFWKVLLPGYIIYYPKLRSTFVLPKNIRIMNCKSQNCFTFCHHHNSPALVPPCWFKHRSCVQSLIKFSTMVTQKKSLHKLKQEPLLSNEQQQRLKSYRFSHKFS